MKISSILIYISFLLFINTACQKGAAGDIGPAGDKGAAGSAGTNNTTIGSVGDQGAIGDTGPAGVKGATGVAGTAGVANLIVTKWEKLEWKFMGDGVYIGESNFPEITQSVLDKGMLISYLHVGSPVSYTDEFPQGSTSTITMSGKSYKLYNNGYKLGKWLILYYDFSSNSETVLNNLKALPIETRVSIIKN